MRLWLSSTGCFRRFTFGRPSIHPPEPLTATLLQLLYSIRSERQQVERIDFGEQEERSSRRDKDGLGNALGNVADDRVATS